MKRCSIAWMMVAGLLIVVGMIGCGRGGAEPAGRSAATQHPSPQDPASNAKEPAVSHDVFGSFPQPKEDLDQPGVTQAQAVFAGGCFWCTEAVFEQLAGVSDVVSGYAGGTKETANYQDVSGGRTGHAEVIRITYDPSTISYGQLLRVFFATHDPTQLNRQGNDIGPQYRSSIFFASEDEKRIAQAYIQQLDEAKLYKSAIVTKLEPLTAFHEAEGYHQDYARNNPRQPYIQFHALPNAAKVDKLFPELKP